MSDYEALKRAPATYLLMSPICFGIMLIFGASWKFGFGLTLVVGTLVWLAAVARASKEMDSTTKPRERG